MKLNIKIDIPGNKPDPQFHKWKNVCLSELSSDSTVNREEVKQLFNQTTHPLTRSALAKLIVHWNSNETNYLSWVQYFDQLSYHSPQKHLFIKPLNRLWSSNELAIDLPLPSPFKLSLPTRIESYQFHGLLTQASSHQLSIAGQKIQLIQAKEHNLTIGIEEMVRILTALPLQILRLIEYIQLNPIPDPDDHALKEKGYEEHHRTLMAILDKKVIIYPSQNTSIEAIYRALFHETAHQAEDLEYLNKKAYLIWKNNWRLAIQNDGNCYPTDYAEKSKDLSEDFAESFALYFLTRSTKAHQEYCLLFPHRMAFIKERYD